MKDDRLVLLKQPILMMYKITKMNKYNNEVYYCMYLIFSIVARIPFLYTMSKKMKLIFNIKKSYFSYISLMNVDRQDAFRFLTLPMVVYSFDYFFL
jgi:hypothetical protein